MENCTVHLFVFDGMADWEAAFAVAAIQSPQLQSSPASFNVTTAARYHAPITTMGGVRILPHMTLDEVFPGQSSLLILPGGPAWETRGNLEALERAHAFVNDGVPVAAISEATLGLARAGLLDTRLHTSNEAAYIASSGYRGGGHYRDRPAITDGNVITASGNAPVEFAAEISRLLSRSVSSRMSAWLALNRHIDSSRLYEFAGRSA